MSQFFDSQASTAATSEPSPESNQARPPTSNAQARTPVGSRWTMTELSLLVGAKRGEAERILLAGPRERMKTAAQQWAVVEEEFSKHGRIRSSDQIRSKWEKLTTECKKVFDYQINKPSGQPGYFEMNSEQRKRFLLPKNYDYEIYNLLDCWFPNQRAVNPDRSNLIDSSTMNAEEEDSHAEDTQHSEPINASDIGNEENIPPPVNSANVTPDAHGRRKRTRRERLDEHFSSASKDLLSGNGRGK
jgi:hypothetical protein